MPSLSRRRFLAAAGITASVAALEACRAPTIVQVTATPAPTPTQPTIRLPDMTLVEPGTFTMGSDDNARDEYPAHPVRITSPYYIAMHLVTFDAYDQYCELAGKPPLDDHGWGRGSLPAFGLSWRDAAEYCNWLSLQSGLLPCYREYTALGVDDIECDFSADGYRLPTEAEWEFAAYGGNAGHGFLYAGSDDPHEVAWYADNSDGRPHPVGEKAPNELGLYDMSGNVWEFCWDWYAWNFFILHTSRDVPTDDPQGPGPVAHVNKVLRGGSFDSEPDDLRITHRGHDVPIGRGMYGIRLVRPAL